MRKHVGDSVTAAGPRGRGTYRITGVAVFATLGQSQPLADGAAVTGPGFRPLFDQTNFYRYLVGRFTPGADRSAVERRIGAIQQLSDVAVSSPPVEIDRLRAIGLAVGIPAGVIVGGLVWRLIAHGLGVAASAMVPVAGVLLAIPLALMVVNLLALLPARAAARTRAATVLRAD